MRWAGWRPRGVQMQTIRRRGAAARGPAKARSGGRASAMPAARRKCRRVMLMRVPSLGLEKPALHDLVNQGAEAVLLLADGADQGVDFRTVGPRESPARRVGQQLLRQGPRQAVRVGDQKLLVLVDVPELAPVQERVGRVDRRAFLVVHPLSADDHGLALADA